MNNANEEPKSKEYLEALESFNNNSPDMVFEEHKKSFQPPEKRAAFQDYFKNNYEEVFKNKEINYSTNHVYYYLYHNKQNNDVRILMATSGCFSSNQKFIPVSIVEEKIESIHQQMEHFKDHKDMDMNFFTSQIPPLQQVIDTYNNLKNGLSLDSVKKPSLK